MKYTDCKLKKDLASELIGIRFDIILHVNVMLTNKTSQSFGIRERLT